MNDALARQAAADEVGDPDCLRCMRKKLQAVSVVVFFRDEGSWRLGNYQADRPSEDAEIDFYCMLTSGVPEIVSAHPSGLILSDDASIERVFGRVKELFAGAAVIAAPVHRGSTSGVRIALRENAIPFQPQDLETVQCSGRCPEGC